MHCQRCGHQTSITAGTIFHRTRKPLRTWFQVMWWVTGQKNGASALGLQRILGLRSYQTAWSWLHKLRRAMVRPGREPLSGEVEVDETYVGGVREGGGKRHLGHKALIAIAVETRGPTIGRIRLRSIPVVSLRPSTFGAGTALVFGVAGGQDPGQIVLDRVRTAVTSQI